jgi:alpha-galactosidase
MSFKIAIIGAGSIGFTRKLISDLLTVKEFNNLEIMLEDIDQHNLDMVYKIIRRDIDANNLTGVKLGTTLDQKEAVRGAKYIITTVRVGGLEAFEHDVEIPLKYGIDQCVGDTLCAGGIIYGQRGVPFMLNLCKDIKEAAQEDCLLLNYANPNVMMTWAANSFGGVNCLGLCHGVQGGHLLLAKILDIPSEELEYKCVGINHQTWYTFLKHKDREITRDDLLEGFEKHPDQAAHEKVRIDMLKRFGYFSTESNGHLSEYLAWYRKRTEELPQWISLDSWIHGETAGYLRECTEKRNWFEEDFPQWMKEEPIKFLPENRSHEHGSYIIEGLETGRPYRGHFNVVNKDAITNLPADSIVEVPGYVDATGINIPQQGDLPMGCAAICNQSISVQRLAVFAAVKGDIELLKQAMALDPLTGAVCNLPEIWQMTDDLIIAEEKWLPQYKKAIAQARERQKTEKRLPTNDEYKGYRVKLKSVKELRADKEASLNVEDKAFKIQKKG